MIIYLCILKIFRARTHSKRATTYDFSVQEQLMKVRKSYLTILFSVIMAVCLALTQFVTVGAEPADPQGLYDANKDTVAAIDADGYFAQLLDKAKTDAAYVPVMESVVEVANAYKDMVDGHKQEDYFASDWTDVSKIMALTAAYIKLTADNYLNYNENNKYLLRVITDEKNIDDKYETIDKAYEAKKQAAAKDVEAKKQTLLKANTANPSGSPDKIVGFYDEQGVSEIEAIKNKFDTDLAAKALDKADYNGSVQEVKDLADKAKADMAAVRKNIVERAYDTLQDYYATEKGTKPGDLAAEKQAATQDALRAQQFLSGVSPEVMKEYSSERKAFEDFFDENEIDDSEYANKATLETADGAVKVTAYDEEENEFAVFVAKCTLQAYNIVTTSPKRHNAETAIAKENDQLRIAYFIDVVVYNGIETWEAPTEYDGKQVHYHVSIDLNKYYKNYVEEGGAFLSKLIGMGKQGPDMTNSITDCANYLKSNDGSLCYRYYKEGVDGAVKSLEGSLEEGTLMFETNLLGAVAVTENQKADLLLNPIFWLICIGALILLIVIIVLIVKFARYRVKFYSNGGSRVKSVTARKGESFVMPDNPTREGYIFAGWFEDDELTRRFVTTEIARRKGLKVYAKWAQIIAAPVEVAEPAPETAAEAPAAAEGPSEEQLTNFYAEVRKTALGYALAAENEKAKDGMMLVRAYMKNDGVYVYAATDPEAAGAEKAEGALAAETPAYVKVTNDEELAKAKELVDKTMTEYGLEPTGQEVGELKEGMSKGFGYRLKFDNAEGEDAE